MAFKGEISAEYLDSIKTGHTVGDIYRIIEAGKLGGVTLPFGIFVEWKGTYWEVKTDMQYAVSSNGISMDKAISDVLDDHDPDELVVFDGSKDFYDDHELGYYYAIGDKVYLCTKHTRSGEPGSYTYETELTKQNGIVPVLNNLVNRITALEDVE